MSKFFFKGKIEKKPKHESFGYNTKREVKLGSEEMPLSLQVATEARRAEIQAQVEQHNLVATIAVIADQAEDITQLDAIVSKPETVTTAATPGRNDPCTCGSGKKFKKCCG
ncbi:PBPRA1643 family SWIM/SEC-C metal-binding motif protein [Ferrimonas lipolytica]|uniref:Zinc chelation protein SecC n=1 Tax=Ferrimonas lipolytica TaxID=2724191 RepID=A0A6H1UCC7_9GAMM|nr:PBPRA1643 family SWIM/SEC-C metal-binding motif protein [Ferrimonas lipolytica]QIZ76013.1 zinc chelation protein SecC [Ferrimonas lipolytica]